MSRPEILDFVGRHIGAFTTTVIGGGAGAYFGAYLRKSAENRAIHANLEKLVIEMRAVTQATKEIEAKISDEVWARQRRWELRRDIMLQAMDELANVQGPLAALTAATASLEAATEEGVKKASLEKITASSDALSAAMPGLFRSSYRVELVCSPDLHAKYRKVQELMLAAYHHLSRQDVSNAEPWTDLIGRATELALLAIRHELGMDAENPMLTPPARSQKP